MARKMTVFLADGTCVKATVVESMGFNHDIGTYASLVRWEGRDFMVVKCGVGNWREWTVKGRLSSERLKIARRVAGRLARLGM